jgi:AsmA-like C-terminal region/Protein of unknown function
LDPPTRQKTQGRRVVKTARQPSRARRVLRACSGPSLLALKCLVPVVILCGVAFTVLYVRLLNGPVSLQFLASPISRSIAAELPGISVAIEDALVRLTEGGGIELRMSNVRFADADAAPVAVAPLAAVSISAQALWSGRLAPDKIILIEPRLLLVYNEGGNIVASFPKTVSGAPVGPSATSVTAQGATAAPDEDPVPPDLRSIDLARLITDAAQRARQGTDASSFLREIGVRNATVVLDRGGRQTVWTVIEGEIDLEHKKRRSTLTGRLSMASASGPWGATFKIEEAEKAQLVSLEASVQNLVPRGLADLLPDIPALGAFDMPLTGTARIDLNLQGAVTGGVLQLDLGRGNVLVPGLAERPLPITTGRLELSYDAAARRIDLAQSVLEWNQGRATFSGSATSDTSTVGRWLVDVRATDGQLSGDEFSVPNVAIDEAVVKGTYVVDTGLFTATESRLRAGGALVEVTGQIGTTRANPVLRLDGRLGPATSAVVKAIWPQLLAPGARRWVGRQLTKGRILGGTFKIAMSGRDGDTLSARNAERLSLGLEIADAAFMPAKSVAAIDVPRALLRLEAEALEVTIPEAASQVTAGRRLTLKGGRFTAVDIYGARTQGEIAFRVQGPLAAAIEHLEQDGLALGSLGLPTDGIDGRVDGQLKISLPLMAGMDASEIKVDGKVKISDGRAKQIIGTHDVQGATITVDIGDGAVNATGQMLVGGVNAKLAFQRIMGAAEDKQPPLRITANLDASDRTQLGFDLNHLIKGEVPVDLTVTRGLRNEQTMKVRADLSSADVAIEPLSWRKAPGRQAQLQFDVVKTDKQKTVLQNFKVVGDDIAIDGTMALDARGRLTDFQFPDFALTLVSRLDLQGSLRSDNVWDVKVRGQYWDGRDFFKSLFSIGQAGEKPSAKKEATSVDLKVEIENVLGHSDVSLKALRMQMSRRGGKLAALIGRGNVDGGRPIEIGLQQAANEARKLVVLTDDAGQAFRLIGFYPNLKNGQMRLEVNLDGRGDAEKTGLLTVERFQILGDPVLSEVLQTPDEARQSMEAGRRSPRRVERQTIDFDWMRAPFSVGYNQFVLEDTELRGPLLGASIRGKADFKLQGVDIGGTYVPLQGLNAAVGGIPVFGQLLAGPKGEGVLGITFRIVGPMAQPQVVVNPLSMIAPGIFREMFQMTTQNPRVIPRDEKPVLPIKPRVQAAPAGGDAVRRSTTKGAAVVKPEVSGGWTSNVAPVTK